MLTFFSRARIVIVRAGVGARMEASSPVVTFRGFAFEATPLNGDQRGQGGGGEQHGDCADFLSRVQAIFADKINCSHSGDVASSAMVAPFVAGQNLVTVCEETLHEDEAFDVSLVQRHVPSPSDSAAILSKNDKTSQASMDSNTATMDCTALSLTSLASMASTDIRKSLGHYGETSIGPITAATKRAYLIHLKKLKLGQREAKKKAKYGSHYGNRNDNVLQVSLATRGEPARSGRPGRSAVPGQRLARAGRGAEDGGRVGLRRCGQGQVERVGRGQKRRPGEGRLQLPLAGPQTGRRHSQGGHSGRR